MNQNEQSRGPLAHPGAQNRENAIRNQNSERSGNHHRFNRDLVCRCKAVFDG
jgi:hypothetical protein